MFRLSLDISSFCQLYNYFEDANYVYLILEMCHNKEINRYLKKTGRPVGENEGMVHLKNHKIGDYRVEIIVKYMYIPTTVYLHKPFISLQNNDLPINWLQKFGVPV